MLTFYPLKITVDLYIEILSITKTYQQKWDLHVYQKNLNEIKKQEKPNNFFL